MEYDLFLCVTNRKKLLLWHYQIHRKCPNVKPVGQGVSEYRIDFGPGYRIYFGHEGNTLVMLLGGGAKKTQSRDIRNAQLLRAQYTTDKKKTK